MCLALLGEAGCAACNLCCCLGKALNANRKQQVRTSYIMMMLSAMLILFVIQNYGESVLSVLSFAISCPDESGSDLSVCFGVSMIFRISLAFVCLHVLILLACSCRSPVSREINEQGWFVKFILLIVLTFIFLYIENSFFLAYSNVAKFISALFLIFQIIMIIDLCYIWGEKWVEIYDGNDEYEGNSCWAIMLVVFTLIMYVGTGYMLWKSFTWFGGDGCGNSIYIIASIVLIIILTALPFILQIPDKSVLTSGAVSLYVAYLTWSGLTNNTDAACNEFSSSTSTLTI